MGRFGILLLGATLLLPAVSPSAQQAPMAAARKAASPELGSLRDGLYRNAFFGFSYKIPYGWVERTEQMRAAPPGAAKSLLLLSVFERPPETTGDTVNSAVVIAAESTSSYPGLKGAEDYFGPLTEVATSKGFKVVSEPYAFQLGAKKLARGDFSKEVGKLSMYQASLVTVSRGYVVSCTFLGGSEDEVEELIARLSFATERRGLRPSR